MSRKKTHLFVLDRDIKHVDRGREFERRRPMCSPAFAADRPFGVCEKCAPDLYFDWRTPTEYRGHIGGEGYCGCDCHHEDLFSWTKETVHVETYIGTWDPRKVDCKTCLKIMAKRYGDLKPLVIYQLKIREFRLQLLSGDLVHDGQHPTKLYKIGKKNVKSQFPRPGFFGHELIRESGKFSIVYPTRIYPIDWEARPKKKLPKEIPDDSV